MLEQKTIEMFNDPLPGDRWTEFYNIIWHVSKRDGDKIKIIERDTKEVKEYWLSIDELKKRFQYEAKSGPSAGKYFVTWIGGPDYE